MNNPAIVAITLRRWTPSPWVLWLHKRVPTYGWGWYLWRFCTKNVTALHTEQELLTIFRSAQGGDSNRPVRMTMIRTLPPVPNP